MGSRKIADLTVKVGEYQKDGQTKGRYVNIGVLMEKEDRSHFILLERTFNPAGAPNPENKQSVIVSIFKTDGQQGQQQSAPQGPPQGGGYPNTQGPPQGGGYPPQQGGQGNQGVQRPSGPPPANFEDDIPF